MLSCARQDPKVSIEDLSPTVSWRSRAIRATRETIPRVCQSMTQRHLLKELRATKAHRGIVEAREQSQRNADLGRTAAILIR